MLSAIIVTAVIVTAFAHQLRSPGRKDSLIVHRPYNNHYDAATGLVTHHAYVDRSEGPYPFYEPEGALID